MTPETASDITDLALCRGITSSENRDHGAPFLHTFSPVTGSDGVYQGPSLSLATLPMHCQADEPRATRLRNRFKRWPR